MKEQGHPVVGIMCEYTPRELIMAAGGIPVCLCGGSVETIASAEEQLPANLCPLIKSTFGFHIQKSNPFLEMADLLVAETTCDGKKKMYELLGRNRSMHVLELPQKPDEPGTLTRWMEELRKFQYKLEQLFDVQITNDKLRQAIATMNRERRLRRDLADLMRHDPPPITGRQLIEYKSSISGREPDFIQYENAINLLTRRKEDSSLAGRPRVLMTGVPMAHGAERVLEIIENSGGLVVCMENCTGLKPILNDVKESTSDPIQALAEKYLHVPCAVLVPNDRRFKNLDQLADYYRPQCVIELIWQACITYDVESWRTRQWAKEKGLPYMRIETDYSPSDSARIAVRVEALFETISV
jgi:benzoyl-CoA reductase/2-hydroxyglutaryl-CoA dehydratase subunit BcrC/BadD/HgdB